MKRICIFILIVLCSCSMAEAQSRSSNSKKKKDNNWSISANVGVQMAGIGRSKWKNPKIFTPLVMVTADKWFKSSFGVRFGYQGPYFYYKDEQHNYVMLFTEAMFNTNYIVNGYKPDRVWQLYVNAGFGCLYDFYKYDDNLRFCFSGGITNTFRITQSFYVNLNVSSILSWRVYENNEDYIPGISVGFTYKFLKKNSRYYYQN